MFYEKAVIKSSQNSQVNTYLGLFYLIMEFIYLKKKFDTDYFLVNFCEIFRKLIFVVYLREMTSVNIHCHY